MTTSRVAAWLPVLSLGGPSKGVLPLLLFLILACPLFVACGADSAGESPDGSALTLVRRYSLDGAIEEPSGLTRTGDVLYVVSDQKDKIYALTRYGVPLDARTIDLGSVGGPGFEAVAALGEALFVAREPTGEILLADIGTRTAGAVIPVADVVAGNDGLEGLIVRPDGHFLAAKEKGPCELIHLAPDGTELSRVELGFAPDIAGLARLGEPGCPDQLLAVSQEARSVYQIDESGALLRTWSIAADRPEGVAYDGVDLYVVDEATRELFVFAFPGGCRDGSGAGRDDGGGAVPADTVRINEVMPVNEATRADEFGEFDDWLELHNDGDGVVDLGGFYLSDDAADPRRVRLAAGLRIAPGGVLVLWADRTEAQGPNHLPFALDGSKEELVLSDPDGTEIDRFAWRNAVAGQSLARFPDGSGAFAPCDHPTPSAPNGAACGP